MIEEETRPQCDWPRWFEYRRLRITATMCKDIVCRKKPETDLLVKRKLKTAFYGNQKTKYGLEHEAEAMDEYVSFQQQTEPDCFLRKSGLVVSTEAPYLACSPDDSLCTSSGQILVEVKCAYWCQTSSLVEVSSQNASFFHGAC